MTQVQHVQLGTVRRAQPDPGPVGVALIRPPEYTGKHAYTGSTCPPLGLAYLASAVVSDGHALTLVDAIGDGLTQFTPTDDQRYMIHGLTPEQIAARVDPDTAVIGVSCMFSHDWPLARQVVDALRERCPGALIIAGGEHITAVPEVSMRACPALDLVVLGEGEETLSEIVRHHADPDRLKHVAGVMYRDGAELVRTGPRARIRAVDEIPEPAWDRLPLEKYLDGGHGFGVHRGRSLPVLATRGCPYQCTFCSSPAMWTTRYQARSPAAVLEEIRVGIETYGAKNVDFYDLTMIVRKSWIVEFCERLLASDLRFTWQLPSGTRSEALDDEVLELLYAAGLRNVCYAPESGSPAVLKRIKKRVDLDRMKASIASAERIGINCKANIIIGFPDETRRELFETLRFIVEVALLGLHDVSVTSFSPYPGTELFDSLREKGRIPELDDEYFLGLPYADLATVPSWSDKIGSRELSLYRAVGMIAFYLVSFGRRPGRVIRLIRSLIHSDTQESRLEHALHDMIGHTARDLNAHIWARRSKARATVNS